MRFWKKIAKRRRLERDLEDELRFHLEMSGRARFGNPARIAESCREVWSFTTLESWWRDFRYGARTLAKNPGVTAVAVIALAIGIGANAAVFTVVKAAFSFDGGVEKPERLVLLQPGDALRDAAFAQLFFDPRELRAQVRSVRQIAAFSMASMNVSGSAGLPERYFGAIVSPNTFEVMERRPALGRGFTEQDLAAPVVVLSDRAWRELCGADPGVIGKNMRVDDVLRTIVGVMPPGIMFPENADVWIPLNPATAQRLPLIFGRLADGATLATARTEIDGVVRRILNPAPQGPLIEVEPLLEIYGVYASRPLFVLQMVAVGFVLLIACANVANLQLARAAVRAREISIRMAIGAGRARVIRQLLIENVVLAIAGGLFGWLTALGGLRWMDRLTLQQGRPPWVTLAMDAHVLLFLGAVTLGTGILFGLAPALRLARVDVHRAVKDGGAAAAGGARGRRLSSALVIFEMALCVVLLAGAGLMIRSSLHVYGMDTGVNSSNVLTVHINLPQAKYPRPDDEILFHRLLQARLASLPGVESVALASALPTWGYGIFGVDCQFEDATHAVVQGLLTGADYFRVMQAEVLHGRIFSDSDRDAIVVNGIFAARYFPGGDPVGKHIRIGDSWRTVSGIVPDIQQSISPQRTPLVYIPYAADPRREMFIAARTRVPPSSLAAAFRSEVQKLDSNLPLYDVRTLENRIATNRLEVGAIGMIFTVFAAIALALASVGLYAVSAHSVSQRTREIGIRMAMGGAPAKILRLIFVQGLRQIALGLALGLPASMALGRALRGALVGVSPFDPLTLLGVVAILAVAGALGCAIPARRALRVDPVEALRCE
ncbi:MAG TPA: ABC transporter permease [Bryobacteraceae bacterium]|nr:ABC transporter permease [Bryobacteraceae bacterium]